MGMDADVLKGAIKDRVEDELKIDLSEAIPATLDIIIEEVIKHIQENAVIRVELNSGLNTIFTSGIPVVNDGGTALQIAWKAQTEGGAKDKSTGTIE